MGGTDSSPSLLKPLLSALGLSEGLPTAQTIEFSATDAMGEAPYKLNKEDSATNTGNGPAKTTTNPSTGHFKISSTCNKLMSQAQRLSSVEEIITALNRVTGSAQTLVARHVVIMLLSNLSTQPSSKIISTLKSLDLLNIHSLVQLLRLVDAGRICNIPGEVSPSSCPVPALQSLSDVISAVVTNEEEGVSTGLCLMQACSRDLLTAAVGGTERIQQAWLDQVRPQTQSHYVDKDGTSDVSVLANPNFKVTQKLVKVLAKSTGKLIGSASHVGGVVQILDALSACLFSSKLQAQHRFWALQQLAKMFSVTGAGDILGGGNKSPPLPLKGREINS